MYLTLMLKKEKKKKSLFRTDWNFYSAIPSMHHIVTMVAHTNELFSLDINLFNFKRRHKRNFGKRKEMKKQTNKQTNKNYILVEEYQQFKYFKNINLKITALNKFCLLFYA